MSAIQYHEKSTGSRPATSGNADNAEADDDDDDDDIEAQIRKEVEGLKPKSSEPRLFQKVTSNMPCSKLPVVLLELCSIGLTNQ